MERILKSGIRSRICETKNASTPMSKGRSEIARRIARRTRSKRGNSTVKKEEIPNENAKEYLEVLERQSARLKKLIEDLIEASKASSGSLSVNLKKLEAGVFLVQTVGEFKEKTEKNKLDLQIKKPEEPI